jgi:K+-transporting ATPase A subunit
MDPSTLFPNLLPADARARGAQLGRSTHQRWAVLAAMTVIFVRAAAATIAFGQQANPELVHLAANQTPGALQAGSNMEGKEVRFGIAASGLWATATTAASSGSVTPARRIGIVHRVACAYGVDPTLRGLFGVSARASTACRSSRLAVFIAGLMTRSGARPRTRSRSPSCWSP